jgi:outer membrane murein-binding lipoprotein Lpp
MIISAETIFNSDIYRNVVCRLQPTGEKSGCRSMGNYGQVVHPRKLDISDDVRNAVYLPDSYVYCSMSTKGIWKMKSTIGIKIAAVAAFAALAGCTDLKPLQADIAGLKSQVGTLSSDVAALKSDRSAANSAAAASTAAAAAASKADAAQSTANQALAAAQASQTGVNDLNEKIDRMFKRSVSK